MKRSLFQALSLTTLLIGLSVANIAWAGSADYVYDDLGRLIQIIYDDGSTVSYAYDDIGNRITRTVVKM